MTFQFDAVHLLLMSTSVALVFLLLRTFGGWLVSMGGPTESVGKAILNVYP